ncbi:MAG: PAS domain-containing sensor histidine kinase [Candidatus Hydrothermarchaeales archaeon]
MHETIAIALSLILFVTSLFILGAKKRLEIKVDERTRDLITSEKQWRRTFDSIPDLISIHDKDYRIRRVNKAVEDAFGMTKKQLIGKHCYEVFHNSNTPWPNCPFQKTLETEETATEDVEDPNLGGIFSVATSPIFEDGELVGSVHVCRDITERKKSEAKLKNAYDDLKALDTMKEEFLSNISHELMTPLTSIKSAQDLLIEELSGEQKNLISIARRNADRLDALIEDLLYYSKLCQLPSELQKGELDMVNILETSVKVMSTKAFDKDVTLETLLDRNLKAWGDKEAIYKIVFNLLDNAIKFNHRGGKVTLSARMVEEGRIRVTVSDTGRGIPKDHQTRIFERFYQMDGSTKRKHPGTGLGLSLVKAIVEKHEGKIWVESEVNRGSKFAFEIPTNGKAQLKDQSQTMKLDNLGQS